MDLTIIILAIVLLLLAGSLGIYLLGFSQSIKKHPRLLLGRRKRNEAELLKLQNDYLQQNLLSKSFQSDLRAQQKKLTSTLLLLTKQNALLIDLLKHLQRINQITKDKKVRSHLCNAIQLVESNRSENSTLLFEYLYTSVNSGFIKNLNEAHPGLTALEKRMCVFLHMNYSTKEIANITGQNPNAIEMARHRIRKKLKLDRGDNLGAYLMKYAE